MEDRLRMRDGVRLDLVARQRAMRRLAERFPSVYGELLDGERVKLGLPPRTARGEVNIDRAVTMYRSGMGCASIGSVLGVSRETVRRALLTAGVELRSRGGCREAVPA